MLVKEVSGPNFTKLSAHFGDVKIERAEQLLQYYSEQWHISELKLIPYFSVNILFRGYSEHYGKVVLKIHGEVDTYSEREITMLSQGYPYYATLYECSSEDGVMLLHDYDGGTLRQIEDDTARLDSFIAIIKQLYCNEQTNTKHAYGEAEATLYPSYKQLLDKIEAWRVKHNKGHAEHEQIITQALQYYKVLKRDFPISTLLHGDLHHDNILYHSDKPFILVDPKGVIDTYIFDIPRFILNEIDEHDEQAKHVSHIINVINKIGDELNLSERSLLMALYIELVSAYCWSLEDDSPDTKLKDYINHIQHKIKPLGN